MSSLFDTDAPFPMPYVTSFCRLRAGTVHNPYNPDATGSDWTTPYTLQFDGALASASSTTSTSKLDKRVASTATLTCPDPTLDIRVGDRIRAEPDDGRLWTVSGIPSADINPFTGWRPTLEIQLEEVMG